MTLGVDVLRISPQWQGTEAVVADCHAALHEAADPPAALGAAQAGTTCDGYWHGRPGMERGAGSG